MSAPAPAAAPRSLLEEADGHLWRAAGVLAVLTVLILLGRVLLSAPAQPPPGDALPAGTAVTDLPLPLDENEAARFDAAVLGSAQRAPPLLKEVWLPMRVPDLTTRPFRPAPADDAEAAAARQTRAALAALRSCAEAGFCERAVIEQALAAVSAPGAAAGPCSSVPRVSSEVQVPIALHAIVLSWLPECRAEALARFALLEDKLTVNINAGNLKDLPALAGVVYTRFAQAKLADAGGAGETFLSQMRAIRNEILASAALREAWEQAAELPQFGLSMAEIQAQWLLAEARSEARRGSAGLPERLATLLDPQVPERLSAIAALSQGQARLRLTWCALGLRAGLPAALPSYCLAPLGHAVALGALRCALLARAAIAGGQWEVEAAGCGDADSVSAQPAGGVLERFAADHRVWASLLARYRHRSRESPAQTRGLLATRDASGEAAFDAEARTRLEAYLTAYARVSGHTWTWLWAQHPGSCMALGAAAAGVAAGWLGWLWAWGVRRRSLLRFLPAPLALDREAGVHSVDGVDGVPVS